MMMMMMMGMCNHGNGWRWAAAPPVVGGSQPAAEQRGRDVQPSAGLEGAGSGGGRLRLGSRSASFIYCLSAAGRQKHHIQILDYKVPPIFFVILIPN